MKKLLLATLMLASFSALQAQEKRLNLYGAYVFDDSFESYNSSTDYYTGKIKGGFQYGAGLEFVVKETNGVELIYYRQDTKAQVNYYDLIARQRDLDISVNYFLLAFNKYIKTGKVEPYAGLLLGAVNFNNKNPQPDDDTSIVKFALGGRLGVNIWASDRVAIKLQAQIMSSVQGFGGGFYLGTGGAGAGASTYSTITQLGLGGGLAFKIGS